MQYNTSGYLAEDPNTGCVGVVAEHLPRGTPPTCEPLVLEWPSNVTVLSDPVRIIDEDGVVIAREGDLLRLGVFERPGVVVVETIEKIIAP